MTLRRGASRPGANAAARQELSEASPGPNARTVSLTVLGLLISAALAAAAFAMLAPGWAEYRRLSQTMRLHETRLAVKQENLAVMAENERAYSAYSEAERGMLPSYEAFTELLAALEAEAARLGLTQTAFGASAPAAPADGSDAVNGLAEATVQARYEGAREDLLTFAEGLSARAAYVESLAFAAGGADETPSLRVTFTVFFWTAP